MIEVNNKKYCVEIFEEQRNSLKIKVGSKEYIVHIIENGKDGSREILGNDNRISLNKQIGVVQSPIVVEQHFLEENVIQSEIPGRIVKILVNEGDTINEGDTVAVIESMKMEVEVRSPKSGIVKRILVKNGSYINIGQPIILLE